MALERFRNENNVSKSIMAVPEVDEFSDSDNSDEELELRLGPAP